MEIRDRWSDRYFSAYATVNTRSPLSRTCPRCGAYPSERCWSMQVGKVGIDKPLKDVHDERRTRAGG